MIIIIHNNLVGEGICLFCFLYPQSFPKATLEERKKTEIGEEQSQNGEKGPVTFVNNKNNKLRISLKNTVRSLGQESYTEVHLN